MERVSSIFSQILKFFPKTIFDAAVAHHHGEKHAKGMTCWSQFVALLFCHLGGARSLREIIGDFGILIWPSSAFCFGPPS